MFFYNTERHSADNTTRIESTRVHRWDVIVRDVHVATMWTRADARILIRQRKVSFDK